jgi:hypothetical protein
MIAPYTCASCNFKWDTDTIWCPRCTGRTLSDRGARKLQDHLMYCFSRGLSAEAMRAARERWLKSHDDDGEICEQADQPSAATENPEAMYSPVAREGHAGASARQIDVAAAAASACNYFPGQSTCEWCSAVQPERCCLDYPRCDCNSPPEPDNLPCGHPWKAQHDFKCILCSSPGDATSAQLAETQRFPHSAETESISRAMCREDLPFLAATAQPVLHGAVKFYWIQGPLTNYGTTEKGFNGEVRVVSEADFNIAVRLLQKIMARCADLLDEDQFNELDAMTRAAAPTPVARSLLREATLAQEPKFDPTKMNLVVTRNGVPVADQRQGVEDFKAACLQAACPTPVAPAQCPHQFNEWARCALPAGHDGVHWLDRPADQQTASRGPNPDLYHCPQCGALTAGKTGIERPTAMRVKDGKPVPNCPTCGLPADQQSACTKNDGGPSTTDHRRPIGWPREDGGK